MRPDRSHPAIAMPALDDAGKRGIGYLTLAPVPAGIIRFQEEMHGVPGLPVDDGFLFAGEDLALVIHHADVGVIVENPVDVRGVPDVSGYRFDALGVELLDDGNRRLDFEVALEYPANDRGRFFVHDEFLVDELVSNKSYGSNFLSHLNFII